MKARSNLFAWRRKLPLLLLCVPLAVQGARSYDNCTGFITSVPAVINSSGTWCFNQDLSTAIGSGNAISIGADDVVLDCNDFKLDGTAAGASTAAGGISAIDRSDVTVRHCHVRGFIDGLAFAGSGGRHTVEDSRFDRNTYIGLEVYGDGSLIRRNRVTGTGGSTVIGTANGIVAGNNIDVLDNDVDGVTARSGSNGSATGIYSDSVLAGSFSGNRLHNLVKDGSGSVYGIFNSGSDRILLRDNEVIGSASPGAALLCSNGNGRAKGNVLKGFPVNLSGCSNDGNFIKP